MNEQEERIRAHAHRLWESEGHPEGRAEEHWFKAEKAIAAAQGEAGNFRSVDAAEVPPVASAEEAGQTEPMRPAERLSDADGGQIESEPVSEIETIRRTLEVPAARRGKRAPPGDRQGAMSGVGGRRPSD